MAAAVVKAGGRSARMSPPPDHRRWQGRGRHARTRPRGRSRRPFARPSRRIAHQPTARVPSRRGAAQVRQELCPGGCSSGPWWPLEGVNRNREPVAGWAGRASPDRIAPGPGGTRGPLRNRPLTSELRSHTEKDEMTIWECSSCQAVLVNGAQPCPSCGATGRTTYSTQIARTETVQSVAGVHTDPSRSKKDRRRGAFFTGGQINRKTGEIVHKDWGYRKDFYWYWEKVRDARGRFVHWVAHDLRNHRGHGSDRGNTGK